MKAYLERGGAAKPYLELAASLLCLWSAWYHTPAGAVVRTAGAWFFRVHTAARPLLAYYGAGTLVPPNADRAPPLPGPIPPAQALAFGAFGVRSDLGAPATIAVHLKVLEQRLGSPDAAALALFCGEESARYAIDHASSDRLVDLARALPPSRSCVSQAAQATMLGGAYALAWPMPETVRITSPFGVREHPILGGHRLHAGVDLGAPRGTAVHATGDGIVRRASSDDVNGRIVILDHGGGVVTVYCHNGELLVEDGDRVRRGQIIARSGNSGRSTGPHLHYQLDLAGEPVDPLKFRAVRPKSAPTGATD